MSIPLVRATKNGERAVYDPSNEVALTRIRGFLMDNGWDVDKYWKHSLKMLREGRHMSGATQNFLTASTREDTHGCACEINIECWDGYKGEWKLGRHWTYDFQPRIDAVVARWPSELRARVADAEDYGGICFGSCGYEHQITDFTWEDVVFSATTFREMAEKACAEMDDRLHVGEPHAG